MIWSLMTFGATMIVMKFWSDNDDGPHDEVEIPNLGSWQQNFMFHINDKSAS